MNRFFGYLPDGAPTHLFTLESRTGLRAEILDYGGILRSLSFPGRHGRTLLVLGFENIDAYVGDTAYVGVIAGRYANRIAGAQFNLDGKRWELSANEGPNHLHGGRLGLGKRVWRILDCEDRPRLRLRLGYHSPDGEEGYPGNLDISAEYTLSEDELTVAFEATCDAATPVNLTYHPYFNLAGDPAAPLDEQLLTVPADRFLAISDSFIPTGEIATVNNTPFDFRGGRTLATSADENCMQLVYAGGYDHCLLLASDARFSAELYSELSGIRMQVSSDMPAIQVYGAHWLTTQHPTLGRGICLEPQEYPNAPNEPRFPSAILWPGQRLKRSIRYRFSSTAWRS
jgi:aldose 1-epimerase